MLVSGGTLRWTDGHHALTARRPFGECRLLLMMVMPVEVWHCPCQHEWKVEACTVIFHSSRLEAWLSDVFTVVHDGVTCAMAVRGARARGNGLNKTRSKKVHRLILVVCGWRVLKLLNVLHVLMHPTREQCLLGVGFSFYTAFFFCRSVSSRAASRRSDSHGSLVCAHLAPCLFCNISNASR